MSRDYMRISELVERSGVPRTTIHFYLRRGLLHPPFKSGRTMAYYDDSHLRRLGELKKLKAGGRVPLEFLRKQLQHREEGQEEPPRRRAPEWDVRATANTNKAKDKKRREIIRAGIDCFSRKGYHETKVQDITRSLGISTGTFYTYFRNKRDLFVEAIDEIFRSIVGEAAQQLKAEDDPYRRLVIRGEVFYRNYSKYNEILHQLRAEMAGEDQWPQGRVRQAYKELTRPVSKELQDAIARGLCRKLDPDLLAYALTGIIEIMSLRLKLDDKYTFADVQEFMTDFINNGIKLNEPPGERD
ncbi:MAG: TetR family transcriptional regulator [Pseudomonadota bacterium]